MHSLERESGNFDRKMPNVVQELASISSAVEELIAPKLSTLRKSYSDFADKRAEVREALGLYATVQDMERRRADLEKGADDEKAGTLTNADIPTTVAHGFAKTVESILTGWHFPEAGDVYFDSKTRDLVIAGSLAARSARAFVPLHMRHSLSGCSPSAARVRRRTQDLSFSTLPCLRIENPMEQKMI